MLIKNIDHFEALIETSSDTLYYMQANKKRFVKPKTITTNNKIRQLHVPLGDYKLLLQRIDKLFKTFPFPTYIYHSRPGGSAVSCAKVHLRSPYILKLDLKNYFPSTSRGRIKRIATDFISNNNDVIKLLTDLCTFKGVLPQGFPTSPTLAELALIPLTRRINGICKIYNLKMSVYIDDICISGSKCLLKLESKIINLFSEMNYVLNFDKKQLDPNKAGVEVLGVYLKNGRISTTDEFDESLKEMLNILWLEKFNSFSSDTMYYSDLEKSIKGKLGWMSQLDPNKSAKYKMKYNELLNPLNNYTDLYSAPAVSL